MRVISLIPFNVSCTCITDIYQAVLSILWWGTWRQTTGYERFCTQVKPIQGRVRVCKSSCYCVVLCNFV